MKRPHEEVGIDFIPFVCSECGNVDLMSDQISHRRPGNCRSCMSDDTVFRGGPDQTVNVKVYRRALPAIAKGES
jgi:hypothetical protein